MQQRGQGDTRIGAGGIHLQALQAARLSLVNRLKNRMGPVCSSTVEGISVLTRLQRQPLVRDRWQRLDREDAFYSGAFATSAHVFRADFSAQQRIDSVNNDRLTCARLSRKNVEQPVQPQV